MVTIFERSTSYLCENMKFSDESQKTSILMYCISAMIYICMYMCILTYRLSFVDKNGVDLNTIEIGIV